MPNTSQEKTAPRKRKLHRPSQTAEALYSARTAEFVYRNASRDAATKLTESSTTVSLSHSGCGEGSEKVHVRYRNRCPKNRMHWTMAMKTVTVFASGKMRAANTSVQICRGRLFLLLC